MMLDDIDVGIIQYLHRDARAAAKAVAKHLGIPESTVRHRLSKLVEANLIEFVALTNPLNLGHTVWILMDIEVETKRLRDVAKELSNFPEVYFVCITTGGFDIFAAATFSDNAEFVDFLANHLSKVEGIIRVNTRTVLETHKRDFKFTPKPQIVSGRIKSTAD